MVIRRLVERPRMRSRILNLLVLLPLAGILAGCDLLGGEDPAKAAAREADGKAVGGACRHSGRALEDCYVMNPKAAKAAVYAGWRDMDAYMRENKIEAVVPDLVDPPTGGKSESAVAETEKPAEKSVAADEEKKPAKEPKAAANKRGASLNAAEPTKPRRFT
jgi:hypothetical protein